MPHLSQPNSIDRYSCDYTEEELIQAIVTRYSIPAGHDMAHYWGLPNKIDNYTMLGLLAQNFEANSPLFAFQLFQHIEQYLSCYLHRPQGEDLDVECSELFSWVPEKNYTDQICLWEFLRQIENPALRQFSCSIFADKTLMPSFYTAKASKSFHHKRAGQLLAHSKEVALAANRIAYVCALTKLEQDIAYVCGLIHDIGKISLFYNDISGTEDINLSHESLNFLILSKQLNELKEQNITIFEVISSCLSSSATRSNPFYFLERIVHFADQLSAERDMYTQAFAQSPSHHYYSSLTTANGSRTYKRLLE